MAYHAAQFRVLIRRVLVMEGLHSDAAEELLLGTAAVESQFGTYLRQLRGPALGAFQIEPATFRWLQDRYVGVHPVLRYRAADELEWDLRLSIVVARLRYWVVRAPLPDARDIHGLGAYWKAHYNTVAGAGTVEHFLRAYAQHVAP